ncbi:hypothetical protein KCN56_10145 [Photobacterium galatheae]|uniref:hypothetical protein n=1 Tax=Photobacterium galatheae TaxID=1654360 RepID=UPI00202CF226|nr:hypothetical protein [Photobacterium galatheae]MCM0148924.1 hypothetical protein [Photobacterium galatheae]
MWDSKESDDRFCGSFIEAFTPSDTVPEYWALHIALYTICKLEYNVSDLVSELDEFPIEEYIEGWIERGDATLSHTTKLSNRVKDDNSIRSYTVNANVYVEAMIESAYKDGDKQKVDNIEECIDEIYWALDDIIDMLESTQNRSEKFSHKISERIKGFYNPKTDS